MSPLVVTALTRAMVIRSSAVVGTVVAACCSSSWKHDAVEDELPGLGAMCQVLVLLVEKRPKFIQRMDFQSEVV